jgi:hypothetical protein
VLTAVRAVILQKVVILLVIAEFPPVTLLVTVKIRAARKQADPMAAAMIPLRYPRGMTLVMTVALPAIIAMIFPHKNILFLIS